ncbi:MAG TPA: DNA repair protein RecN [Tepidisphaeraceae bacterium]|jgi:DNA repair protein RecN (Recombination protein N)
MLRELHISNLAVIADAKIELAAGLNCFTGATGAGKSLVIGAIELLLGLRSPADMLRRGADEARISGVFDLRDPRLMKQVEEACDCSVQENGGELLLTRRVYASGRSSVSLNGQPITLAMLRVVAEALVDVHGQHDHQYLLKPSNQLEVLDDYAGLTRLRDAYHVVHLELTAARAKLREFETGLKLRQQQLEFSQFQAAEIDKAELRAGEYEELLARAAVLGNVEKLRNDAGAVQAALYDSEGAIIERLQAMAGILSELALLDKQLNGVAAAAREATVQLSEASFDLGRYLNKLELDPEELAEVNDRLNTINRVLKKYGPSVDDALRHREALALEISGLEHAGEDASAMEAKIGPLSQQQEKLATELSAKRRAAAKKLAPLIESQLAELGMEKAKFAVEVRDAPFAASGADDVEFMVQTNPGMASSPLRKVASGGELGRVMLAMKGVLAAGDRVSVLVFDEIDANIGGRLGSVIGSKLRALAAHHQVLCITHLPQIACFADRHITVRKESGEKETRTSVRTIDGDERVQEIAEMIGGQRITDTTRAQARELLDVAVKPAKRRKASA